MNRFLCLPPLVTMRIAAGLLAPVAVVAHAQSPGRDIEEPAPTEVIRVSQAARRSTNLRR